ncbi:hypothetical protein [uncultured Chryseobacterium sp.]|uniref:hypothetical protein n=1 Tax=uncultured Chryseobacterium sp. TaxID=259322 RepID=UPI0025ECAECE|nr:hypothetical protein [uncultured Chryseobacterium sp.]
MTNKELLEELINRGFFIISSDIHEKNGPNSITVSVTEPEKDIYKIWTKDYNKKLRGDGKN